MQRLSVSAAVALSLGLSLLVPLSTSAPAQAQATDDDVGDKAPFLDLFPALRTLPAPLFLQPGLRVSFASGAATGAGGPAGGGVIQYDVLTVDGGQVLLHQVNYGDGGAGIRPLGAQPARGYPGLGAFWIHPSVLVNAEAVASPTLTVTRAPRTLANGQTVTTVRFQSQTTRGRIVNEYDAATGLMVLDSISAGPSDAQLQLIGTRTLQLPWPLGRAPRWVRPGVRLDFGGIRRTTILGGGSIDEPAEYTFTLTQAGARWSLAGVSFRIGQTAAGQGFAATGQGQLIGAFWLPETALDVQFPAEGALLDTDPATGAQVFGARGEGGVILVQEVLQGARTTSAYDPVFGALLRSTVETVGPSSTEIIDVGRTTADAVLADAAAQAPLPEDPPRGTGPGDPGGGCQGGGAAPLLAFAVLGFFRHRRRSVRTV